MIPISKAWFWNKRTKKQIVGVEFSNHGTKHSTQMFVDTTGKRCSLSGVIIVMGETRQPQGKVSSVR